MCCSDTKEKGQATGAWCKPEDFEKMFEKMKKCCPGEGGSFGCKTFMEAMKEKCLGGQAAQKAEQ